MAKKGKGKTDKGKGDKDKPKPIMIGEVDIQPMNAEELIAFNKEYIAKIYRARRVQSETRRELGWIKTCIDNLRENFEKHKALKLFALEEYSKTDPQVVEEVKIMKQQMKYSEFNLEELRKNSTEIMDKDNVAMIEKYDKDFELKLWNEIEEYKDKYEDLLKICAQKIVDRKDIYGVEKRKRQKFWEDGKKRYMKKKQDYKDLFSHPKLNTEDYYLNRFTQLSLDADNDWRIYRNIRQNQITEATKIETEYLTRMIKYEDRLINQYFNYIEKIKDSKHRIEDYEKILEKREREAAMVEKEMAELRRRTNNLTSTTKYIQALRKNIDFHQKEMKAMEKECNTLLEEYNYMANLGRKYCEVIDAIKKYDSDEEDDNETKFIQDELTVSLENLSTQMLERLEDILEGMSDVPKLMVLRSVFHYIKKLNPLQFEFVRNVKGHNELIEYMDIFLEEMGFQNPIPFRKLEGTEYRHVPTLAFANICWQRRSNEEEEEDE